MTLPPNNNVRTPLLNSNATPQQKAITNTSVPPSLPNQYQQIHPHQKEPPQPTPAKPRAAYAPPAPPKLVTFSAIVFEFVHSNHGDRFLFPKNSILEYRDNGCTLLASFLILKDGKDDNSGTIEFYEPVTIYLKSQNPKVLEHLQRVVADPESVREYMKEIMGKRTRAAKAWPVYRLRRMVRSGEDDRSNSDDDGADSRRESTTPAPTRNGRESTFRRRQSSTPKAEVKTLVPPKVGPRIKVIKKVRARTSFMFSAMSRVEGLRS